MLETRPRTENWTLSINLNQRNPQRGCYLALTFGTLLSSQGADAQRLDPLGLRLWRLVPLYAVSGVLHPGGALRGPPGPRPAHGEPYTTLGDGAQVGGGRPASHGADR